MSGLAGAPTPSLPQARIGAIRVASGIRWPSTPWGAPFARSCAVTGTATGNDGVAGEIMTSSVCGETSDAMQAALPSPRVPRQRSQVGSGHRHRVFTSSSGHRHHVLTGAVHPGHPAGWPRTEAGVPTIVGTPAAPAFGVRPVRAWPRGAGSVPEAPLLVRPAPAAVQLDLRPVAGAAGVEAQP